MFLYDILSSKPTFEDVFIKVRSSLVWMPYFSLVAAIK